MINDIEAVTDSPTKVRERTDSLLTSMRPYGPNTNVTWTILQHIKRKTTTTSFCEARVTLISQLVNTTTTKENYNYSENVEDLVRSWLSSASESANPQNSTGYLLPKPLGLQDKATALEQTDTPSLYSCLGSSQQLCRILISWSMAGR